MAIKRAGRPDRFYVLDNEIANDKRLSWQARGMLVYLLCKPNNWEISTKDLVKQTGQAIGKSSSRDAVRSIISELMEAGYVQREPSRGNAGTFEGYDYAVSEIPATGDGLTGDGLSGAGESGPITNTERTTNTDKETTPCKSPAGGRSFDCPHDEILDIWREVMYDKPQPSKNLWPTSKRASDLASRWKLGFSLKKESTGEPFYVDVNTGLDWWRRFFKYMRKSDFLMGKTAAVGQREFVLKIDWVVNKNNFVKIMENTYHR